MTAPDMERYAQPGEYYATGTPAEAARHLLEHSSLSELVPGFLTVIDHEDRPGLFHLRTALVTYGANDKTLLGFLASICHTSPAFHAHIHDLLDLRQADMRVVYEAIGIFIGTTLPPQQAHLHLARSN